MHLNNIDNQLMLTLILAAAMNLQAVSDSIVELETVTVAGSVDRGTTTVSSVPTVWIDNDFLISNFSGSLMQTLSSVPGIQAMSIGSSQSKPAIRGLGSNRMVVAENGVKHESQQWGEEHGLEIINIGGRKKKFFYRFTGTYMNYADYIVPTDSIQYHSYYIKLKDRRLRNTAGMESGGSFMFGYTDATLYSYIRISDTYLKSGFFADAHGLEVRLSKIDYDRSNRDVNLPYQEVNHLKAHGHSSWHRESVNVTADAEYQNNMRWEYSEPISHGYMPKPSDITEFSFRKHTATAQLKVSGSIGSIHTISGGISSEFQHNRRGGWGFTVPDFETVNASIYAIYRCMPTEHLTVNAGVRYDYTHIHIHSYRDWYPTPDGSEMVYKERATEFAKNFNSLTWSAGVVYINKGWTLKTDIGKAFRAPLPMELGADGINYHIFNYERGNANLSAEESYQLDLSAEWTGRHVNVKIDPYVNYFPNYIYLSPTPLYVEGLQLYQYTQASVLRCGFEAEVKYCITDHWETEVKGAYLFARQLSGSKKGYGLPFTPPWTIYVGGRYKYNWRGEGYVGVNARIAGSQYDIVPPEKPTDGYWTLNIEAGKKFEFREKTLEISLRAENLLNKKYYDATSYYRLIDVPAPGFNISAAVGFEF